MHFCESFSFFVLINLIMKLSMASDTPGSLFDNDAKEFNIKWLITK